jgi:hypothetical protein
VATFALSTRAAAATPLHSIVADFTPGWDCHLVKLDYLRVAFAQFVE